MFKIAIIGYGYVGKILANRLKDSYETICYDCDKNKILENIATDTLKLTCKQEDIKNCNVYIITVQTPLDINNKPDLSYIEKSTRLVAKYINQGDVIIYESTVFPGVTENICIPIIENNSKLKLNEDFYVVYSPERVSPCDSGCNIEEISKIVSGTSQKAVDIAKKIYSRVTNKSIYIASNIQIAEAAKLLENLQRDVNIALMNEYFMVLKNLNIDFFEVLEAAKTKWNFNLYYPGYVGGHCIGVDTQYYVHIAKLHNINPLMGESARFTNEQMITYISKLITDYKCKLAKKIRVGIIGVTYKPNCDDIRNSAAIKIINKLSRYDKDIEVVVYDPIANKRELSEEKIYLSQYEDLKNLDILLCMSYHDIFNNIRFTKDMFSFEDNIIVIDLYKKLTDLQMYNLLYHNNEEYLWNYS